MNGHGCIGSACAICNPKCECHSCTQIRGQINLGGLGMMQQFQSFPRQLQGLQQQSQQETQEEFQKRMVLGK